MKGLTTLTSLGVNQPKPDVRVDEEPVCGSGGVTVKVYDLRFYLVQGQASASFDSPDMAWSVAERNASFE